MAVVTTLATTPVFNALSRSPLDAVPDGERA
jgi:hypothetical protein